MSVDYILLFASSGIRFVMILSMYDVYLGVYGVSSP